MKRDPADRALWIGGIAVAAAAAGYLVYRATKPPTTGGIGPTSGPTPGATLSVPNAGTIGPAGQV